MKIRKLLFILLFCISCTSHKTGKIVRVIDGDTFIFQTSSGNLRVRMLDIDAPESGQPYGKEARSYLCQFLNETDVTLVTQGKDKYHRTLGTLIVKSDTVNLLMVRNGCAWANHYNPNPKYLQAENYAYQHKLGLWAGNPIKPWKWRRSHKH